MNDEELFHTVLDAHLADAGTRLLLSEWLEERGDVRGPGWRWIATTAKHPYNAHSTWDWWNEQSHNPDDIRLPLDLWQALPPPPAKGFPRCKEWESRRAAEDAVAVVACGFAGIPAKPPAAS